MPKKICVLDGMKDCDGCGECEMCDLNREKKCDNCGKCLGLDAQSRAILIDGVLMSGE